MNFQFYLEKLRDSEEFKKFVRENPEAYLCSGFFTIDPETSKGGEQRHIDYFLPSDGKVISFILDSDSGITKTAPEPRPNVGTGENRALTPKKLEEDIDFELKEIRKLIEKEIEKKNPGTKINKILISLQNFEDKALLLCTIFANRFGLIKMNLSLKGENGEPEIESYDKKSLFDLVRKGD